MAKEEEEQGKAERGSGGRRINTRTIDDGSWYCGKGPGVI